MRLRGRVKTIEEDQHKFLVEYLPKYNKNLQLSQGEKKIFTETFLRG